MRWQVRRKTMRWASLSVALTFLASVFAPYVHAQQAQAPRAPLADTGAMTQTARTALADLWYAWVKQGGSSSVKPDRLFAHNFFSGKGATPHQAEVLVNNAQSQGMLTSPMPTSSSGIGGFIKRIFGMGQQGEVQQVAAAAGSRASMADRVRGFMGGIGGSRAAPGESRFPVPGSMLGRRPAAVAGVPVAAGVAAPSQHMPAGMPPEARPAGVVDRIKDQFAGVAQKGKEVGFTVGQGITTALLTAKDKFDIRQYYSIPINDTGLVKITGGSEYTTRFVNKGWTAQEVKGGTRLVDAIRSNEALGQVEALRTQAGAAQITQGKLGGIASGFSNALNKFKAKITGKPTLSSSDQAELSKLQIQANLLEHAQGLNAAQQAIDVRIQKLMGDAQRLNRPPPADQIRDLQQAARTIEAKQTEVTRRLNGIERSSASSVLKDSAKWALYSIGIQASINVIRQVVSGEKINFKDAFSFMGQPSFWAGTAGGFVGSMVLSSLASSLIPGGGIFFRVLPGFLGAAVGYELGAGLFGGGSGDWIGTIGQTLASAGGYALAYSLLGGAMAPGIALVGAGIAAGALFNFLYAKLRGPRAPGRDTMPPPSLDPSLDPNAAPGFNTVATTLNAPGTQPPQGEPSNTTGAATLQQAMRDMQAAYTEYINFLKEGKVADARQSFDRYIKAKDSLDALRRSTIAASPGR